MTHFILEIKELNVDQKIELTNGGVTREAVVRGFGGDVTEFVHVDYTDEPGNGTLLEQRHIDDGTVTIEVED